MGFRARPVPRGPKASVAGESLRRRCLQPRDALGRAEREKIIFLSTIGSHNQDRRSLLLDGEVLTAVAGDECLPTLIDLALIMGTCTWPERAEDFHAYFPEAGGLLRKLSRLLRDLI